MIEKTKHVVVERVCEVSLLSLEHQEDQQDIKIKILKEAAGEKIDR